ncbi:MAG: DUF6468 domain-containing protein [Alphaproteobacteria bacterium]
MTGAIANLLVNVIIITLLVVTIAYCWVLNRRIKILQDSKGELAQLLKHFDESTQRASESIIALQSASKKIGETIQARVEKANFLLDDLSFMIEKAAKVSQQMEAGFAVSRAKSRVITEPAAQVRADVQEREEVFIADTPPPKKVQAPEPSRAPVAGSSRETTLAALQAVIERAKRRSFEDNDDEQDMPPQPSARGRTKSEQELLEMIRSGFKG